MPKKQTTKNVNPVIIVAIIGLIGTITSAILTSPVLVAKIQSAPAPTSTIPIPISSTSSPTVTTTTSIQADATDDEFYLIPQSGNSPVGLEGILVYLEDWEYSLNLSSLEYVLELPESIVPDVNDTDSLNQAISSVQSKEIYFQPYISSTVKLNLTLQNLQDNNGLDIKIEKNARLNLLDYQLSKSHITALAESNQIIIPVTGGSDNFHFMPVLLESLDWSNRVYKTTITKYDSVTLTPGEIGTFELVVTCKEPGSYLATVTIPVIYSGNSYEIQLYPPQLNCPETLTIWNYKDYSDGAFHYEWKKLGDYVLQDGEYISLPAGDATATPIQ